MGAVRIPPILTLACCVAGLWLWPGARARAAPDGIENASRLTAAGDLPGAEAEYDRVLAGDPSAVEARIGRGYVRSFQRKFAEARADFEEVLAADGGNVPALNGLGYTLAWSGDAAGAERLFRRALEIAPGQADAEKGLAYAALWRGDAAEAARRFAAVAERRPDSAELQVGLGQSLHAGGRSAEAHAAFARALALDPGRRDAAAGLVASRRAGPRIDATVLGGLTAFRRDTERGLRLAELGVTPTGRTRLWLQYDNSLGLDNLRLAQRNAGVATWYLGGLVTYGEGHATRVEGGWRRLDGGVSQGIVRAEQVIGVGRRVALKGGGWVGPRDDGRVEAVGHAAVELPVGARLRLEPAVLVGRSGVPGERDVRGALSGRWAVGGGVELGGGGAAGRSTGAAPGAGGTPASAFARASWPVGRFVRGHLLLGRDWPASGAPIAVYALGFTVTAGGRP